MFWVNKYCWCIDRSVNVTMNNSSITTWNSPLLSYFNNWDNNSIDFFWLARKISARLNPNFLKFELLSLKDFRHFCWIHAQNWTLCLHSKLNVFSKTEHRTSKKKIIFRFTISNGCPVLVSEKRIFPEIPTNWCGFKVASRKTQKSIMWLLRYFIFRNWFGVQKITFLFSTQIN